MYYWKKNATNDYGEFSDVLKEGWTPIEDDYYNYLIKTNNEQRKEIIDDGNGYPILSDPLYQRSLEHELRTIQRWFNENDWIPNKVVVGEWEPTDQRFIDYKAERLAKRMRQDEIIGLLE